MTGRAPVLLELLGLTGLAVAQPVFEVFGDSPQTFVIAGAGAVDILAFTAVVALVPALVLWVLELPVALVSRRAADRVHSAVVGALAGALTIQVGKDVSDIGWKRLTVVAVVVGIAAALVHARIAAVRSWLRLLALAPFAFAGLFLFATPVGDVAFGSSEAEAADVVIERPAPIVMLVLDELPTASLLDRNGDVDAEAFPSFARLAATSTWYRNHTTVSPHTDQAVPSIVTGRYPESAREAPVLDNMPENLFTLLAGSYGLHAVESATRLCPEDCGGGGSDADAVSGLLGDAVDVWSELASPKRTRNQARFEVPEAGGVGASDQLDEFIADLGGSGRPRVDFAHVLLPHQPWQFLDDGRAYEPPDLPPGFFLPNWVTTDGAAQGRQRHLLQLAHLDTQLGRLMDELQEQGTWDDALVVVTADHGIGFTEGEAARHLTEANYPDVLWTPLLLKAPGQTRGEVVDRPSRSIDILPTIADLLGIRLPWRVDGSSLLADPRIPEDPRVFRGGALGRFLPGDEEYATFDGEAGFREVLRSGPELRSDDPLGFYRSGRYGQLVGRDVGDLLADASRRVGALDDPEALEDVRRDDEVLDVYVEGQLEGTEAADLAVAVNGVVGGWAHVDPISPGGGGAFGVDPDDFEAVQRFGTLVAPSLVHDGRNEVELFEILPGPTPDEPVLAPVRAP